MVNRAEAFESIFVKYIGFFSLFCTVTNFVPLSVSFVVALPVVFLNLHRLAFNEIVPPIFFLLIVNLLSGIFVDSGSFLEYEFYRRDGNIFVSFIPLIVFGMMSFKVNITKLLYYFILFSTIANAFAMVLYKILGRDAFHLDTPLYHMYFVAHNAAGGFLAMLTVLSLGLAVGIWKVKRRFSLFAILIFFINLYGLILSDSRGSLLGFLMGVSVLLFRPMIGLLSFVTATLAVLGIVLYNYDTWLAIGSPETIISEFLLGNEFIDRSYTITIRTLFLWPQAFDFFLKSPFIGIGFGSFNDSPHILKGFEGLVMSNYSSIVHSDSHAHNSYLHVLAETGLVGLGVLYLSIFHIYSYIFKTFSGTLNYYPLIGMFWCIVFSSFTEHRLFSPSQALPFTILIGLCLANSNYMKEMERQKVR